MSTLGRTMTPDEFLEYAARVEGRCELIDGEVRHMSPTGARHGDVAARLHTFVHMHVLEHDLGKVYAAETGFVLRSDKPRVRAPDVAFIQVARLAAADTPKFCPIPPDLCAEVLSPSDRPDEVADKVRDWLDFGVRLVWVADPRTQSVAVHTPGEPTHSLHIDDTLTGGDVLPGFELALRRLFD